MTIGRMRLKLLQNLESVHRFLTAFDDTDSRSKGREYPGTRSPPIDAWGDRYLSLRFLADHPPPAGRGLGPYMARASSTLRQWQTKCREGPPWAAETVARARVRRSGNATEKGTLGGPLSFLIAIGVGMQTRVYANFGFWIGIAGRRKLQVDLPA